MLSMTKIPLEIGDQVFFGKTIAESDVYLFAGITGDMSPNHIDEVFMSTTPYKKRVIHGVLGIGFISTCSTLMIQKAKMTGVTYGYDRIRFVKPLFIGDTVRVVYTLTEIDHENLKTRGNIEILNQHGEVCTVAQHIIKFFV
jgi:3-hydroxybutyryl-CoA dehydratase